MCKFIGENHKYFTTLDFFIIGGKIFSKIGLRLVWIKFSCVMWLSGYLSYADKTKEYVCCLLP